MFEEVDQWSALFCYFDKASESEKDDHARRVAKQLKDPKVKLFCHFAVYALKPKNIFNTAFQTDVNRIGTLQADVRKILQSFLANFVDPDVIESADDITSVDFTNKSLQLNDDELGIGRSTRLLLCGEF